MTEWSDEPKLESPKKIIPISIDAEQNEDEGEHSVRVEPQPALPPDTTEDPAKLRDWANRVRAEGYRNSDPLSLLESVALEHEAKSLDDKITDGHIRRIPGENASVGDPRWVDEDSPLVEKNFQKAEAMAHAENFDRTEAAHNRAGARAIRGYQDKLDRLPPKEGHILGKQRRERRRRKSDAELDLLDEVDQMEPKNLMIAADMDDALFASGDDRNALALNLEAAASDSDKKAKEKGAFVGQEFEEDLKNATRRVVDEKKGSHETKSEVPVYDGLKSPQTEEERAEFYAHLISRLEALAARDDLTKKDRSRAEDLLSEMRRLDTHSRDWQTGEHTTNADAGQLWQMRKTIEDRLRELEAKYSPSS